MTRKQWQNLWVGSIVHLLNWPYRVYKINRARGRCTILKMPTEEYPFDIIRDVPYSKLTYVAGQKPPEGMYLWEEEERI